MAEGVAARSEQLGDARFRDRGRVKLRTQGPGCVPGERDAMRDQGPAAPGFQSPALRLKPGMDQHARQGGDLVRSPVAIGIEPCQSGVLTGPQTVEIALETRGLTDDAGELADGCFVLIQCSMAVQR